MDFTEKTVLITGGSRGIGRATARAFAEKGARVAINFHSDNEAAKATIESLPGEGHFAIRADLGSSGAVEQMINAVVREFGRLDILVNNAGIFKLHPITEVSYDQWQQVWKDTLAINLTGAANATYCAARHMIEAGGGRIINVSSRGAFRGEPDQPAYGASKAAMNAMGQSLAQALAPYNIFIGTVAPGFVETDMAKAWLEGEEGDSIRRQSPLQRVAQPEEVALGILFLASEGSEFMTGAILDINGASYLRS
ncbi:SDR family NAD(P)-dependent oxidoreductase [Flavilitoribacter nigricans]|uniref:3-oxoacyl-ACP reductase n=1 Tax=Flavilitoribacter nigricans (strain ATCC 23147 / DSM 23189 / NBRC 102662 / NCIMB 1420 / SS-2) TaxID=1122177 RepID=A0A2D0NBG8_FLAN2|nr:SDR family oxidoreductase [Flavilitoribacter nigricans]PHN05835.1 3-oxoacyl-ACP reductase [Flavilitoribacter nigricans DSM 23189 = NBRC 102662]